jgi:ABC-type nitrate/sulfonate/bicarbonate transport system substrate-binding protein
VRRLGTVVVLALLVAFPLAPSPARAQADAVIRLGMGPVDAGMPVFYAAKTGLYKKYGLNVEVVKMPNGAAIGAAMAGGSLELGQGSPLNAITAFARGLPIKVIGSLAYYNAEHPDFALLVAANSAVKAPKDLEGQTLAAVSLQDMNSLGTFAWLDAHGVDRTKLKYVEIPASATLAAMDQNRVVAATFYEPFYSSFLATGSEFTGADLSAVANVHHGPRGVTIVPSDLQVTIDSAVKYNVIPKGFAAQDMICSCALKR